MSEAERAIPAQTPLGVCGAGLLFGGGAVLLWIATHVAIPRLSALTGLEPVVCWFLAGGGFVFLPLVIIGVVLLRREGGGGASVWRRLRFRRMDLGDWQWTLAGLLSIGLLSAASLLGYRAVVGEGRLHPPLFEMQPLGPGRYWILAAWLPFWLLNIGGEEFLWRGVILPRQEAAFGRRAWIANGLGWLLFHLPFGLTLLVVLWPILFVLPYVAQRRQNSWTGVVIHVGLNGPGFLAVAFGLV